MAATLFPVLIADPEQDEGLFFGVVASDESNETELEWAESAQEILNNHWSETDSDIGVDDLTDDQSDDGDLIYMDAVNLLREHEHPGAENFMITGVVVVGGLAVVQATFSDEALGSDDDEDDGDVATDESEFD